MFVALYGLTVYLVFLASFAYALGWVVSLPWLPKTIDSGTPGPLAAALAMDLALLGLFALQHTVMARRSFKRWWTRFVPEAAERSTFVLAATLALALLMALWRPLAAPMAWQLEAPWARGACHALAAVGWLLVLVSTFLIDHFELFGLRQVWGGLTGRAAPAAEFRTPLLYRHVRHPLYLGFVIAFWATPDMSAGHLLFAAASTAYVFMGVWFEERDLIAHFGDRYRRYREETGMLLPRLRRPGGTAGH